MGLFARFTCLRRDSSVEEVAELVHDLLRSRDFVAVMEASDAERLLMIAPAGEGWLIVVDHVENLSKAGIDQDRLLSELSHTHSKKAIDIFVADSDRLVLCLVDAGQPRGQLVIGCRGIEDGALEPWAPLLSPGWSTDDIRKTFAKRQTFAEAHMDGLRSLFGIDLSAFNDALSGLPLREGAVLLRLKRVPAPGKAIGSPRLEAEAVHRENLIRNRAYPQVPLGLIATFPAFCFLSRGAGSHGLEVRLSGSALDQGLIEVLSAKCMQRHPVDPNLNCETRAIPDGGMAGVMLRFPGVEVPDHTDPEKPAFNTLQNLLVILECRAIKVGEGNLEAKASLISPKSESSATSYPVAVLPEMWRPLKSSEQPKLLHSIRLLNEPLRLNALAVLRGGVTEAESALRQALEAWRTLADPAGGFHVAAAKAPLSEAFFFFPADTAMPFKLELKKKRQAKWDRLLSELLSVEGLRISSDFTGGPIAARAEQYASRIVLHYTSPAPHPRFPEYAARLGHVSISTPASPMAEQAVISLMQRLAEGGLLVQAYVGAWNSDDEPKRTIYEDATDTFAPQRVARGWSGRYLRAVAGHLWLGPELISFIADKDALESIADIELLGDTFAIRRRTSATLRDLELCLEPLLPSQADAKAFADLFRLNRQNALIPTLGPQGI